MNEIKYEAVFGDQNLFIPAPPDAIVARYGKDFYKYESEVTLTTGELRDEPIVAMRRIIRTPVWTKADQQAGKSPEAGAEVMCMDDSRHNFVGESIHAGHWALCDGKTKKVFHIPATAVRPVETDAERQQREREEWINHAYEKLISADVKGKASLGDIYDALLSGELKMPEVKK